MNKLEAKLVEKFIPLQLFVWEFVSVVVWGVCTRNALGDKEGILGSCYYFLQCSLSSSKMSQTKPMCRRSGALPLPHFSWNSWHIHTYLEKISEKKKINLCEVLKIVCYSVNIARIANAVQCHSWLSGNKDCHVFRFSIVRIVISVSIVTSLQDCLVSQGR